MKRIIFCVVACFTFALMFTSCEPEEESFDELLLIGEWKGTELIGGANHEVHYKYLSNKDGYTWDITDDETYADAHLFTWTLVKSDLTQIHIMEIGGTVPKYYTVTELTATTLKYHDSFNKNFSLTKVSR